MKPVTINRRKKTLHLRWIKTGATHFVDVPNVGRKGITVQVQVTGNQVVLRYMGRRKVSAPKVQPFESNRAAQLWANAELKRLLKISR